MRILFRIYQWVIVAPILLVLTIITAILTIVGGLFDSNWWGYYPPRIWAKCWCALLFVKVKVKNKHLLNPKTSYVFVANHQGAFDIFSIYGFLNHQFRWMMRKGLENIPLVGLACRCAGHILVDKSSPTKLKKTMETAEKSLLGGTSLVIFPEGRRTSNGKLQPFKKGAFKLALEFNLPVVPLTIDGSFDVMPRSSFNVTPGTITITIHPALLPGKDGHDISKVADHSYKEIEKSLKH